MPASLHNINYFYKRVRKIWKKLNKTQKETIADRLYSILGLIDAWDVD